MSCSPATSRILRATHVDDIRLAGNHRLLLGVRLAAGLDRGAERVLKQAAEARPVALAQGLAQTGRRIGHAGKARIGIGGGGGSGHGRTPWVVAAQALRISMARWIMRRVAPITLMLAS